jgi:hypothetical protein
MTGQLVSVGGRTTGSAARGRDVVNVHAAPGRRRRAVCSCRWESSPRLIAALATVDALTHAAAAGHEPGWPLIVRTDPRRGRR